uniref:Scaffold attachment factor B1 n=1 Tax=Hydra vulgaris TaxID=6087 RepID=T2MCH4_HYDVU
MSDISSPNLTFDSLNSMKVVDLRQELDKRGLDKSGLKSDLVKRLEKSLLDESATSDADMTDKHEDETEERIKVDASQVSESKDFEMESANNIDSVKSENSDSMKVEDNENVFEQHQEQDKFLEEKTDEDNQEKDSVKDVLTNMVNSVEDTNNLKVEENEIKVEEKSRTNEEEIMDVTETVASVELVGDNSLEKSNGNELKVIKQSNAEKELHVDQESSENAILVNDSNKTLVLAENTDEIPRKSSEQASNSNTVNSPKKESSEISDSSENKKDSLLKSESIVKQNEDKKTDLSKCIWISGLSSITKAVDLKDVCSKFGKVVGAKVVTSAKTPGSQCFGFVTMSSNDEAVRCIEGLHKSTLHEKVIQVEKAKTDPTPPKKQVEKKSEKHEDRSQSSRQSSRTQSSRTSSSSRSARRDDRGSRRDERRTRDTPKEKQNKKQAAAENDVKSPTVASQPKKSPSESSKSHEKSKNEADANTKDVEKDIKSAEQVRKERAEKIEQENKLREERRRKEREKERLLREEQRKEQEKREKERRERARKEAERVRKEREKQREAEKQREKERERERERFLLERKEREERERRERERERELLERERIEREKLERERKERERLELERIERERQEEERLEKERLARIERENRIEKERQRLEQERLERERRERERSRIIDRGIDRNIGNSNSLKRSAYDDRALYYPDSKRSLREDSPLSNRKDFFSATESQDSYLKEDDFDQRRHLIPSGGNRKSDHRNDRRNAEDRRDIRNDRLPREDELYNRDRPVFSTQPDVRRVVQRTDARPFNRDRSPIRLEERNPLRDLDRRDWLDVDVQSNAPKTLSDVLGRAGLTGILGNQTEIKSFDIRPINQQMDDEQYYLRNTNRMDDRGYRSDVRDSREDRVVHGMDRLHKERIELSDNRIENKGLQRYDERRIADSRKDVERRDIRNSPPLRTRNEERVFRNSDPQPHMLNNHELKGVLQNSIGDRRGLHPAPAELGNRGLSAAPPRILPMSDLFGRPLQSSGGSNAAQALQAGYVAAAHGLALHQNPQNIHLRDNRLEYTQQVRQPHSVIQNRRF